jgi:long-chain acyl-CoA synthetase
MMAIGWLLERMAQWSETPAIIWRDQPFTYGWLLEHIDFWGRQFETLSVQPGQVAALEGDYSPKVTALLMALIAQQAIVVPLTSASESQREEFMETAEVQVVFTFDGTDNGQVHRRDVVVEHPLTRQLIELGEPGLVLFSSGSTGKSKAALHSFTRLLEKFKVRRHTLRTLAFLMLDHIGGLNTLFYTLSNGGTTVVIEDRNPAIVCHAIEQHGVELLPTSPTFLNLLLISEAYRNYDLSSLKLVTYGTEPMPQYTLKRIHEIFPDVRLLQTYGLSELGILRSKSKDSTSLWVKVGGEGFETKIVDGILWIRAESAMVGYLNAPSPFDADGWFNTGDAVEVDGEYIRILGRQSEIINVGGEKVYPAEVESVLLQMGNIKDVVVRGERNPITGNIVVARVNLFEPEDPVALKKRIRAFCKDKLTRFKIPVKVEIADSDQFSARFKKLRRSSGKGAESCVSK